MSDPNAASELVAELRQYNANGNAIGAHRMMERAADFIEKTADVADALRMILDHSEVRPAYRAFGEAALMKLGEIK